MNERNKDRRPLQQSRKPASATSMTDLRNHVLFLGFLRGFCRVSLGSLHKTAAPPPFLNILLHLQRHKRSTPPPPVIDASHLEHHKRLAPPPPLNTMLHQSHKTLTLRPLQNNTLHHKIAIPPLPLNNTLHLEHRKTSITPFIRTPYCILSSTRHQIRLPL